MPRSEHAAYHQIANTTLNAIHLAIEEANKLSRSMLTSYVVCVSTTGEILVVTAESANTNLNPYIDNIVYSTDSGYEMTIKSEVN